MQPTRHRTGDLAHCLRDAEADARRFDGSQASPAWQPSRRAGGMRLAAGFTVLAMAAAGWLSWTAPDGAPLATVTVARLPADHPFAPVPPAGARPPALSVATAPEVLDGGDRDPADGLPASVLTATEADAGLPVAPMNVPTVPDPLDGAAEPEAEGAPEH